ncbi:hypothetical protein GCM10011380_16450 [Sphingomonas metalli]|uniref:DUF6968 domain-containing protein n=1 Tax=Sphingomonas metalli TaxID=1779358 RepID=A0A916T2K1_9SPHN|nr:hypothetical protein [Sphingomonas metalli]GGB27484.1 hypothetical protein GCM10011380_16450 [Sphingomonas metalli]
MAGTGALPFVERVFEFDGGTLPVRFHTPVLQPGGEFRCYYCIEWPHGAKWKHACGLDGLQALILAMRSVHTLLIAHDLYSAGLLTWCDSADLDLPPAWPPYEPPSSD